MTPEANVSKDLQEIFGKLLAEINESAGAEMSVSLCVFHTKPGSRINYISNMDRKDVAMCWKSMIRGWEQGMPDIPAHKVQ